MARSIIVPNNEQQLQPPNIKANYILQMDDAISRRLFTSITQIIQNSPVLNNHFQRFRGRSFETNVAELIKAARSGKIDDFIVGFNIQVAPNKTLNQAIKILSDTIRQYEKSEKNLALFTVGLVEGDIQQIQHAKNESADRLKLAVQATLFAFALASRLRIDVKAAYMTQAFSSYYVSLGTSDEQRTASATMKQLNITKTDLQAGFKRIEITVSGLSSDLQQKFNEAMKGAQQAFGLSLKIGVMPDMIPQPLQQQILEKDRQRQMQEQDELQEEIRKKNEEKMYSNRLKEKGSKKEA